MNQRDFRRHRWVTTVVTHFNAAVVVVVVVLLMEMMEMMVVAAVAITDGKCTSVPLIECTDVNGRADACLSLSSVIRIMATLIANSSL